MEAAVHPYALALTGGGLIGLSAGGLYLLTGRIAGVSGVLGGALVFQQGVWRWAFILGLIGSGALAFLLRENAPDALLNTSPITLALSGLVVGLGAYFGSGCTSGHGVCGLARFSLRSLTAVLVFMTTAIATVFVTRHLGFTL